MNDVRLILRYVQQNEDLSTVKKFNALCTDVDEQDYDMLLDAMTASKLPLEDRLFLVSGCETVRRAVKAMDYSQKLNVRESFRYSGLDLPVEFVLMRAKYIDVYDQCAAFDDVQRRGAYRLNRKNDMTTAWQRDTEDILTSIGSLDVMAFRVFQNLDGIFDDRLERAEKLTEEQLKVFEELGPELKEDIKGLVSIPAQFWQGYKEIRERYGEKPDGLANFLQQYAEIDKETRLSLMERHDWEGLLTIVASDWWKNEDWLVVEKEWFDVTQCAMPTKDYAVDAAELLMKYEPEVRKKMMFDINFLMMESDHDFDTLADFWPCAETYHRTFEVVRYLDFKTLNGTMWKTFVADNPFHYGRLFTAEFGDVYLSVPENDRVTWTKLFGNVGFDFLGCDYPAVIEAYDIVAGEIENKRGLMQEFYAGLMQSIDDGVERQWAQNIIDTYRKGTVGGGQYKVMFTRENGDTD